MSILPKTSGLAERRFLLDENVDVRLKGFLIKLGFAVVICPKGIVNGEVVRLARKQKAVLVTLDKDFANPALYLSAADYGIVVLRVHPPTLKNMVKVLEKLLVKLEAAEFKNKLLVVSKAGVEVIE